MPSVIIPGGTFVPTSFDNRCTKVVGSWLCSVMYQSIQKYFFQICHSKSTKVQDKLLKLFSKDVEKYHKNTSVNYMWSFQLQQ